MKKRWDKTKPEFPYMNVLTGNRMTYTEAAKNVCAIISKTLPAQYVHTMTGKPISFEDVVTVICTEFAKETEKMSVDPLDYTWDDTDSGKYRKPYLKMSYEKRRKISEKIIDSLDV